MVPKVSVCICILFLSIAHVNAQSTLEYGSQFTAHTFFSIENDKKSITLPRQGTPALLLFNYTNNFNTHEVPFLEVLQEGYGQQLDILQVIYKENKVDQESTLKIVKAAEDDPFDFDLYTKNKLLFIDKGGKLKYVGPMRSARNFSMVLKKQGIAFKKPEPRSLDSLLKHALVVDTIPSLSRERKKLVILLRSICSSCDTDRQIVDILGSIDHANLDVDTIIIFRNEQVKQQFKNLKLDAEMRGGISQSYISSSTKEGARLFIKGNPLLLCYDKNNKFINYRIADDLSGLALYNYLIRTLK